MVPFSLKDALEIELPIINILDIGAMKEGEDRYKSLQMLGLANITGFEPGDRQYKELKESESANTNYLPYYLGNGKRSRFHVTRYAGCSSLYEPDPKVINLFSTIGTEKELNGNFHVERIDEVDTIQLDDIKDCPQPDYIKIDVQGAELDILKNARKTLKKTLIMETEVEFLPIYKNQPLFGDIQILLRKHSFVLHKMIDIGGRTFRPLTNNRDPFAALSQLLWADAIFTRDFTKPSLFTDTDLLKAATILHHVYFSYDLALYLISELDRRRSGELANKYTYALSTTKDLPLLFMNHKEHA